MSTAVADESVDTDMHSVPLDAEPHTESAFAVELSTVPPVAQAVLDADAVGCSHGLDFVGTEEAGGVDAVSDGMHDNDDEVPDNDDNLHDNNDNLPDNDGGLPDEWCGSNGASSDDEVVLGKRGSKTNARRSTTLIEDLEDDALTPVFTAPDAHALAKGDFDVMAFNLWSLTSDIHVDHPLLTSWVNAHYVKSLLDDPMHTWSQSELLEWHSRLHRGLEQLRDCIKAEKWYGGVPDVVHRKVEVAIADILTRLLRLRGASHNELSLHSNECADDDLAQRALVELQRQLMMLELKASEAPSSTETKREEKHAFDGVPEVNDTTGASEMHALPSEPQTQETPEAAEVSMDEQESAFVGEERGDVMLPVEKDVVWVTGQARVAVGDFIRALDHHQPTPSPLGSRSPSPIIVIEQADTGGSTATPSGDAAD